MKQKNSIQFAIILMMAISSTCISVYSQEISLETLKAMQKNKTAIASTTTTPSIKTAEELLAKWDYSYKNDGIKSPKYANVLYDIGCFFKQIGLKDAGLVIIEEAHHIHSTHPQEYFKLYKETPFLKSMQAATIMAEILSNRKEYQYYASSLFELIDDETIKKEDPYTYIQISISAIRFYLYSQQYGKAERKALAALKTAKAEGYNERQAELELLLADCYLQQDKLQKAENILTPLKNRLLKEKKKSTAHLYGGVLNLLANIYITQNNDKAAIDYLNTTLLEYNKHVPKLANIIAKEELPYQLNYLCQTAQAYSKKGKTTQALETYMQSVDYLKKIITDEWQTLFFETEHLQRVFSEYFEEIQSYAVKNVSIQGASGFLYDLHQLNKALFLVNPQQQKPNYPDLSKNKELQTLHQQLYQATLDQNMLAAHLKKDSHTRARSYLDIYIKWKRYVEYKQKNGLLGSFNLPVNRQTIVSSLSDNEAIVDFIACTAPGKKDKTYYALILTKENIQPHLVTICTETTLQKLLKLPVANNNKLYQVVWDPINHLIKEKKDLFIASDDLLHTLSYASLYDGKQYLIDKYNLHHVLTTNGIVAPTKQNNTINKVKELFLFGGVDFRANQSLENNLRGQDFTYLANSKTEIDIIGKLTGNQWQVHKYQGAEASEKNLRNLSFHQEINVIHISTHGFYLSFSTDISKNILSKKLYSNFYDPLLRTGIALSDANRAWEKPEISPNLLDGIVTAFEVQLLELGNTELVVLSACNTGLGEIKDGEGVFGLQRAFRNAGARSMIVSVWEVPDKETSELMQEFYTQWLTGKPKQQAFMSAQQKLRNTYPNEPKKWAGFMLIE